MYSEYEGTYYNSIYILLLTNELTDHEKEPNNVSTIRYIYYIYNIMYIAVVQT